MASARAVQSVYGRIEMMTNSVIKSVQQIESRIASMSEIESAAQAVVQAELHDIRVAQTQIRDHTDAVQAALTVAQAELHDIRTTQAQISDQTVMFRTDLRDVKGAIADQNDQIDGVRRSLSNVEREATEMKGKLAGLDDMQADLLDLKAAQANLQSQERGLQLPRAQAHPRCSLHDIQRSSAPPHTGLEGSKLVIGASESNEDDNGAMMVESNVDSDDRLPFRGSRGRSWDEAKLQARVWEHLSKPPLGWSKVSRCFGHTSGYRSGRAAAKLEEVTTLRRLRNQWGLQQEELNRAFPDCYFENLEDVMWHAFKSGECDNLQLSEEEMSVRGKFMVEHGVLIESRKSGARKRKAVVYEDKGSESEEEQQVLYSSLLKQDPNSQMAQDWGRDHGLLAPLSLANVTPPTCTTSRGPRQAAVAPTGSPPVPIVSPDSQPRSLASASGSASASASARRPTRQPSANKEAKVPSGRRSIKIDGKLLKIHTGTTRSSGKGYWCLPGAFRSDSEFIRTVSTEEDLKDFFNASAYDDQGIFLLDLRSRLDLMQECEEVAKAIRAELPSESGEPVFNTLLHEEQIKVTRKFPELAAFLADPGRYQITTDVMSVKHAALLDRCNALYRRVSELIHDALVVDNTDDVVLSVLETVGPEVFEQLCHRDVFYRKYARNIFLSLLSIESGTQLRILPRSHRAATVDELVKTDVGEHVLDIHLPKGVVAVMHPLLVHCGSRTKSHHGNWRLHGYHGFHRVGLDAKTYKVPHSKVLKALNNSRVERARNVLFQG